MYTVGLIIALLGIYFILKIQKPATTSAGVSLPPGPKPRFLVGNLFDFPRSGEKEWLHWAKHKDLYGPISCVSVLDQKLIIINDKRLAHEILEKRAANQSSRPRLVFANELVGWEKTLSSQNNTPLFHAYRKIIGRVLGSRKAVAQFDGLQETESRKCLLRLLEQPERFGQHIRTEVVTAILKMIYGYSASPDGNDPLIKLADRALMEFSQAAMPGSWLVDVIPCLKYIPEWFPGAGFQRIAREFRKTVMESTKRGFAFTKQEMAAGTHVPSFTSNALEAGEDEEAVRWTSFALYGGGDDTIVSAIKCYILALMLNPDVQRRAQDEIDRVVGPDRLPTAADRAKLPYVDAIVKETLRWHPIAPLGLPHRADADEVVEGYLIPRGAIIMANIWSFTHDPSVYPSPSTFNPSRFLAKPNPEPDPREVAYGFGRRICPGRLFADNFLFLTIAQTLAVFSIDQPRNAKGEVVEQKVDFEPGMISRPVEYQCVLKARSARHEQLIREVQ